MRLTAVALALAALAPIGICQAPPAAPEPGRLVCLYFELNSLRGADLLTSRNNALEFVRQKAPADRIAVMTYTARLNALQDFTADPAKLVAALQSIRPFDSANTDMDAIRLEALQAAAKSLRSLPEKKALLFFSGARAFDRETDLRPTTLALTQANISVYPVDPGGRVPNLR
jgi:VWFA-related protein